MTKQNSQSTDLTSDWGHKTMITLQKENKKKTYKGQFPISPMLKDKIKKKTTQIIMS